jgi:hypothetical protein
MQGVYIFGSSQDEIPTPWNWWGQEGWFRVPGAWFTRVDGAGTVWASPNQNFNPKYSCLTNGSEGSLVFCDMMRWTLLQRGLMPERPSPAPPAPVPNYLLDPSGNPVLDPSGQPVIAP